MYKVESFELLTASSAADVIVDNYDFHDLCEPNIDEDSYNHALWMLRNFLVEEFEQMVHGDVRYIRGLKVVRR